MTYQGDVTVCERCGQPSDRGDVCSGCDTVADVLTRAEQYRQAVGHGRQRLALRRAGIMELHRLLNLGRGGHREWSERW